MYGQCLCEQELAPRWNSAEYNDFFICFLASIRVKVDQTTAKYENGSEMVMK